MRLPRTTEKQLVAIVQPSSGSDQAPRLVRKLLGLGVKTLPFVLARPTASTSSAYYREFVPIHAMSLAFSQRVRPQRVLLMRDWFQMARIHAIANSAQMVQFQTLWNNSYDVLVGPAMSRDYAPITAPEDSVTAVNLSSFPKPTGSEQIHVAPEAQRDVIGVTTVREHTLCHLYRPSIGFILSLGPNTRILNYSPGSSAAASSAGGA